MVSTALDSSLFREGQAFWGDHFNSVKEERPHAEMAPRRDRDRREPIKIFGITIGVRWDDASDGRSLIARSVWGL